MKFLVNSATKMCRAVALCFFTALVTSSCDKQIYDDLSVCPQDVIEVKGVDLSVSFKHVTPCNEDLSEMLKEVKAMQVQIYDANGKLLDQQVDSAFAWTKDYRLKLTKTLQPGNYTLVFWGAADASPYEMPSVVASLALKKEIRTVTAPLPLLFRGAVVSYTVDESTNANEPRKETIEVNMQQYTYTINLKLTGLDHAVDYPVEITDNNGAYDITGAIIPTDVLYKSEARATSEDAPHSTSFGTLKLTNDGATTLVIKRPDNSEITKLPLKELLALLKAQNDGAGVDLNCTHVLNVTLDLSDRTYMTVTVTINGWTFVKKTTVL